jgi:class III poly(R)-hydroxyalkanoic acid synthase PhaE subunit
LMQAALAPWEALAGIFGSASAGPGGSAGAGASKAFPLPAVGLFHQDQQNLKRLQSATAVFNDLAQQYHAQLSGVLDQALRSLIERVKAAHARGKRIDSARELYDLWVAAGEAGFARLAHDAAFCALQAQLINAQSELRQSQQAVMERWMKQYGLPTRSDVEALQADLVALRSQFDAGAHAAAKPASAAKARPRPKTSPQAASKPRRRAASAGS